MESPKECRCGELPIKNVASLNSNIHFDCGTVFINNKYTSKWNVSHQCRQNSAAIVRKNKLIEKKAILERPKCSIADIFTGLPV